MLARGIGVADMADALRSGRAPRAGGELAYHVLDIMHAIHDASREEPQVLPARFPNLLVNGAGGIAVGMATNIPPHNLGEVIDGCLAFIDNPAITGEELFRIIPGPDFPTAPIILGSYGAHQAYTTGRGSILMRARHTIERSRGDRESIVFTSIPYQVGKSGLVEKIAELAKDKKVEGISDIRDESSREGVRVVIDSGLSRVSRYEPDVGVTRLETVRVSRAAADQRRGRAGRIEPGVCYRLWDEPQTGSLELYTRPEILSADLSSFVLDLAQWGATDPGKLAFLDSPPGPALSEAKALLSELGAIDDAGRITEEGRRLRASGDAKFLKHVGQVILDGFVAQPQRARDFFVGFPFGDKCQDPFLLRGELFDAGQLRTVAEAAQPAHTEPGDGLARADVDFAEVAREPREGDGVPLRHVAEHEHRIREGLRLRHARARGVELAPHRGELGVGVVRRADEGGNGERSGQPFAVAILAPGRLVWHVDGRQLVLVLLRARRGRRLLGGDTRWERRRVRRDERGHDESCDDSSSGHRLRASTGSGATPSALESECPAVSSTTWPSRSRMIRRALAAMPGSWVTTRTVWPVRLSSASISMTALPVALSRLPVGSSATTSGGSLTTARAIATRACSPPESSEGSRCSLPSSPTRASAATARARFSRDERAAMASGSSTFSTAER